MTSLKTPLRYPGGKSRAIKKMAVYLPDMNDYTEYRESFLGGGSFALWMTQTYPKLDIWVNDLYVPLYNFWRVLQDQGQELRDQLVQLKYRHPEPVSAKELFLDAKDILNNDQTSNLSRAVAFYVVNKCSFSGLTESSSFSRQASDSNFSMRGIDKLPEYQKIIRRWKITNLSYEKLLTDDKNTFTYLDPPYEIGSNLYGKKGNMHSGFNHDHFAIKCDRFVGHQLISYNASQLIKERFDGWQTGEFDLTYTMRSVGSYMSDQKQRKELLLLNYGI
ncbi:DNA adenine methylase Dam [Synechococcus phage S-MbCM6]|uniref:site-specific DNA-methyltransferase (adenine-specific) n=1 Tax=Synechococcus phage ACG-2014c TaxID=1079998 RepID=A0A0E3FXM9_9CAUD|nr:DNA adenine methylase Dam [Synechococcus phage ACG-2014c]